jgi:hypothetical protein
MKSPNVSYASKPSLTREYDNRLRAAKEITISGSPRTLPVSTVQSLYPLCGDGVTFQMC